jgi:hypothetical protein
VDREPTLEQKLTNLRDKAKKILVKYFYINRVNNTNINKIMGRRMLFKRVYKNNKICKTESNNSRTIKK